jgi:MerR family transcriptional regulator, light-induced transcriptional regulator
MTSNAPSSARFRSGAVARMLGMPVATLRVWERRYAVCSPELTPSGQRLYSAADIERLALLKRLTDAGHAIGRLAGLDRAQLQAAASTHANTLAAAVPTASPLPTPPAPPAARLVVIGPTLGTRLQRPAVQRASGRALHLLGTFEQADAIGPGPCSPEHLPDLLLLAWPTLTLERWQAWRTELASQAPWLLNVPCAVFYGFAATPDCEALRRQGVALLRSPQDDDTLGRWLGQQLASLPQDATATTTLPPPRRWSDAALVDIAGLSSTVACECPRHIAELLIQLSHFEAYSAECEHRSPADAALHHHLWQVTAQARASFEAALEHVARHEGLLLPAPGTD